MEQIEVYSQMREFVDFGPADEANLVALAPVFAKRGPAITDAFYETLGRYPTTSALLEGRVDSLKRTHQRYLGELFAGDYGQTYFENRIKVGKVHVRVGLDPYFVEAVMSFLRTAGMLAIREELGNSPDTDAKIASYLRILDLDLLVINLAYGEERLTRLTKFTGMSRKLLETCIRTAS
jgi:hypothetical protein